VFVLHFPSLEVRQGRFLIYMAVLADAKPGGSQVMGRRNPNFPGRRLEALGLPRAATEVENMIAALLTFGRDSCRGKVDMVTPIRGENRRPGCWHQHGFMASETIPEKLETLSRVELRDAD